MMSQMLRAIYQALTAISGLTVYHYQAPSNQSLPYCVWYEDGESSSLESDNHKAEQAIGGYIDYFTKTEFDAKVDAIQTALNGIENCSWTYESVIFGDPSYQSTVIHHTWSWRLL